MARAEEDKVRFVNLQFTDLMGIVKSVAIPLHQFEDACLNGKWFEKTGEDLLARAFLHETDHLNGKLYISHISALKRDLIKRKVKKLAKAGEW